MIGLEIDIDGGDGQTATRLIAESLQLIVGVASGASVSVNADRRQLPAPATPLQLLPTPTPTPTPTPAPAPEPAKQRRKWTRRALPAKQPHIGPLIGKVPLEKNPQISSDRGTKPRRKNGPRINLVECDERPGEEFTVEQAAAMAGTQEKTVRIACTPSQIGKACGGFHFRRVGAPQSGIAAKMKQRARDEDAHSTINRRHVEDEALGLICAQCGFEPDHADRTKRCPKCNSTQWDHRPSPPMQISA
jgi:rubrerythrin